ncbi:MAG: glycosyltransferase family 2 protein, partial [Muribaculaceae bacterium]|nr:glycosyltransferase family 2 protein [Muribaculaceae bacterium]
MNDFRLSVIIPVYNRENVVVRTLDSVKAQSYRPIKLILVDNDSADGSLFTLLHWASMNKSDDFVIEVASESTRGAAAARNAGLRLANTPWGMFFDS